MDRTALLREIYAEVTGACDGGALVKAALVSDRPAGLSDEGPLAVLALGKAATAMWSGLAGTLPAFADRLVAGLVITTAARAPAAGSLGPRTAIVIGEHPHPGQGSIAAGRAALRFVAGQVPLVVLLSGGGSSLCCLPASGIDLADKRAAAAAVAAAGAPIHELNSLRKHLSAVKGGRLALACPAPVLVLALSDVLGNDLGTIASGPFASDATSFADALEVLDARAPVGHDRVRAHLAAGVRGEHPETPKPAKAGQLDPLAHVTQRIVGDPATVVTAARRAGHARSLKAEVVEPDTSLPVEALAARYGAHARSIATRPNVIAIGNGEPTIDLGRSTAAPGAAGRGGRATHLALLVARHITGLPVAFLAAGTDDRDGSADATGAVVDGQTWPRALAAGLDPDAALARCDSASLLARLGSLVQGPGTSNLLDLHLMSSA